MNLKEYQDTLESNIEIWKDHLAKSIELGTHREIIRSYEGTIDGLKMALSISKLMNED